MILQNLVNGKFRLPIGFKPSNFLEKNDLTPGIPAMNEVIKMPKYPKGSVFILDGLMANSPGFPVSKQLNGASAFQNNLALSPYEVDIEILQRGAAVFDKASRYFTNHQVITATEIQSQPSCASALAKLPQILTDLIQFLLSIR